MSLKPPEAVAPLTLRQMKRASRRMQRFAPLNMKRLTPFAMKRCLTAAF